ncbi:hypothetical protein Vadar_007288 [Vaccinium darrowii]|uniref:Uncharacterized protein n=1 Tax=Vaccinium darrowii TaxID=229202 RepID=A0ACB7XYP6_9ERIC|nr:hypothetical protein Vadar_007288 [Vaccinium darrowii]
MQAEHYMEGFTTRMMEAMTRKLGPAKFQGTVNPNVAEGWFKRIERILDAMGVTDGQKVTLATFVLRGVALKWREAIIRQLIAPLPGVIPPIPQQGYVEWEAKLVIDVGNLATLQGNAQLQNQWPSVFASNVEKADTLLQIISRPIPKFL